MFWCDRCCCCGLCCSIGVLRAAHTLGSSGGPALAQALPAGSFGRCGRTGVDMLPNSCRCGQTLHRIRPALGGVWSKCNPGRQDLGQLHNYRASLQQFGSSRPAATFQRHDTERSSQAASCLHKLRSARRKACVCLQDAPWGGDIPPRPPPLWLEGFCARAVTEDLVGTSRRHRWSSACSPLPRSRRKPIGTISPDAPTRV